MTMEPGPQSKDGSHWILKTEVCSFSGVAQFIMGLIKEVEILEGEGLQEYMIEFMEEQLRMAKDNLAKTKLADRVRTAMPAVPEENPERQVERRKLDCRKKLSGVRQTA